MNNLLTSVFYVRRNISTCMSIDEYTAKVHSNVPTENVCECADYLPEPS
jgi:hypothetical protein